MSSALEAVRASIADVAARRKALIESSAPSDAEARKAQVESLRTLNDEYEELCDQAKVYEAGETRRSEAVSAASPALPQVEVKSEPLTYRKGGEHSYFRDLAKAQHQLGSDAAAGSRLQRHRQEMDVEARANMTRTDGQGGEFVPPLWLIDQYVPLARAGRVGADLTNKFDLPPGTDSINLPTVAGGTAAAEQTEAVAVQNTAMTTSSVSGAVTTMAGQQIFSMQLLDQSPINFDQVVFQDMLADLAKQIDVYVLNKASIGILNVSSISSVAYTDASPTVPEIYPKLADGIQRVATNRFLPAQAILMHPTRWAWFLAALDSSNRPLVVPNPQGPNNAFAGMNDVRAEGSVGSVLGLPVYADANVPTNLGGGTNQDPIIIARWDDLFLYEGALRTRVLFETDAATLQVRLQVWEYFAFIGSRYPKSISVVNGTGTIAATF